MANEKEHRAAIDRTAVRIRETAERSGKHMTQTKARDKAVNIARRVTSKYNK